MDYPGRFPLLFRRHWPIRGMADAIDAVEVGEVCREYRELGELAPTRTRELRYLVGHEGIPSSSARSNRREEHIAIALVNLDQRWSFDGLGEFAFLDYQLPLKAKRSDIGIGKVDLLGLARQGQLLVVELKVTGHTGGRSDPPIVALLEGLRYAAILVANLARLSEEVRLATGSTLSEHAAPDVVVLGERSWWQTWRNVKDGSAALSALGRFADGIRGQLGLALHFAEMADVSLTYGRDGAAPQLDTAPDFRRVEFP